MTTPLADAAVTATMTLWMVVDAFGEECLFGYADWHPNTGGLYPPRNRIDASFRQPHRWSAVPNCLADAPAIIGGASESSTKH